MTTLDIVDHYIAAWNERDPIRRRELVARTWTKDGSYVDPARQAEGLDAISEMIGEAQTHFPGASLTRRGDCEMHADRMRFSWSLASDGADPFFFGTDFAFVAGDGRLCDVTGFIDAAPPT